MDDETLAIIKRYMGRDPSIPIMVSKDALYETDDAWTLEQFDALIKSAVASIPEDARATATVELENGDYSSSFRIHYKRLQTPEEVAEDVERALSYAENYKAKERAQYETLKRKFER